MTIERMEHVGIVVDDLAAATAFFVELGLKLRGELAGELAACGGVGGTPLRALDDHRPQMTRGWPALLAVVVVAVGCSSGSRRAGPAVVRKLVAAYAL